MVACPGSQRHGSEPTSLSVRPGHGGDEAFGGLVDDLRFAAERLDVAGQRRDG
jgi:hypothetical protein